MTKGLAFLLGMLIEGAVAALLAILLRKQFDLPRFSAAVRCAAAAVIGTGATNPAIWAWFSRLEGWTGTWWGAAALSEAGVVLARDIVLCGRIARPLAMVSGAFDRGQRGGVQRRRSPCFGAAATELKQ